MQIFLWLFALLIIVGFAGWYFGQALESVRARVTALISKLPRMVEWVLIAIVLCVLIFILAPQQLPVSVYKISLMAIAGVVGYWLDRSLFPYARPDTFQGSDVEHDAGDDSPLCFELVYEPGNDMLFAVSMLRRALIVAAAMIAVGLGA